MEDNRKIRGLTEEIAALKRHWPAHSVSLELLQKLDELDSELELERKRAKEEGEDAQ